MSKKSSIMTTLLHLVFVASAAVGQTNYAVIGKTLEPLRSDFNAAQGKVRAILLVAPT